MDFPVLKLYKDDFIEYYEKRALSGSEQFRKLAFVFQFDKSVTLFCFALKFKRDIMNPDEKGIELTNTGTAKNIEMPFKVGTIELSYPELHPLIGRYDDIKEDFEYLRFEATQIDLFIVYDVYFNDSATFFLTTKIPAKKPSPPYNQN